MAYESQDWRAICREASTEQDSERLAALLTQLIAALDGKEDRDGAFTAPVEA